MLLSPDLSEHEIISFLDDARSPVTFLDFDRDGSSESCFIRNNTLTISDLAGAVLASITPANVYHIADLEEDGEPDIIIKDENALYVYGY